MIFHAFHLRCGDYASDRHQFGGEKRCIEKIRGCTIGHKNQDDQGESGLGFELPSVVPNVPEITSKTEVAKAA